MVLAIIVVLRRMPFSLLVYKYYCQYMHFNSGKFIE